MDSPFNSVIENVPKTSMLSTYYVVDSELRYVSINNADVFYLHYVDTNILGDVIDDSKYEGCLDYLVINLNKPIEYQNSRYYESIRVVETKSVSGNNKLLKHKKSSSRDSITRLNTTKNKLF